MSCDNCEGTVWFDHEAQRWRHGAPPAKKRCLRPFPRPAGSSRGQG